MADRVGDQGAKRPPRKSYEEYRQELIEKNRAYGRAQGDWWCEIDPEGLTRAQRRALERELGRR